jgi:hypothetical protein
MELAIPAQPRDVLRRPVGKRYGLLSGQSRHLWFLLFLLYTAYSIQYAVFWIYYTTPCADVKGFWGVFEKFFEKFF